MTKSKPKKEAKKCRCTKSEQGKQSARSTRASSKSCACRAESDCE